MINLNTPIENLARIKANQIKALHKLGIKTYNDLLFHFPTRYEDYSQIKPIAQLEAGEKTTIEGKIIQSHTRRVWRKKMVITEIILQDQDSALIKATWFNQPFLKDSLIKGKTIRLSGKVYANEEGLYFSAPDWELQQRRPIHTARLVPIYPTSEGLTSRWLRWQLETLFKKGIALPENLPSPIIQKLNLPERGRALKFIHFPQNEKQFAIAHKRFAFEEMFLLQLKSLQIRLALQEKTAPSFSYSRDKLKKFYDSLPFQPTNAQEKAVEEIFQDLKKATPMNRLLNGDVGAGKTLVAVAATLPVIDNHQQVALMTPTEVLAFQHFQSFQKFLTPYSLKIALLTNSYKKVYHQKKVRNVSRSQLLKLISTGKIDIVLGTHALIQKDVHFKSLALAIIDEQHRFGVAQRAYLQKHSSSQGIHFLTMTATPIPRTLTMAFFGNLDVSLLNEMPQQRRPVITQIIPSLLRKKTYNFIRSEIKKGRQAFIILPLVEESSLLKETKAAIQEHQRLSQEIFPEFQLGLLHGRLKSKEKEEVMQKFQNNDYQILVSTSVVEVGVDVPNATLMIIEDAHRFGLSQLHQFRGRVGRGQYQSYCFLFSPQSSARLKIMEKYKDGFKIAEKDLQLRGPGQFLGQQQSGLPDITMESLNNLRLIKIAREEAEKFLKNKNNFQKYPHLLASLQKLDDQLHLE